MNKFVEKIRKCFKKESYNDEGVYKINMSILLALASAVLFCFSCVLFFL